MFKILMATSFCLVILRVTIFIHTTEEEIHFCQKTETEDLYFHWIAGCCLHCLEIETDSLFIQ